MVLGRFFYNPEAFCNDTMSKTKVRSDADEEEDEAKNTQDVERVETIPSSVLQLFEY